MTIVDTIADAHYGDKVTLAMSFAHPVADGRHHTRRLKAAMPINPLSYEL